MKKNPGKKLVLGKQTLGNMQLEHVAGGAPTVAYTCHVSCASNCYSKPRSTCATDCG